jgi:hypothetical protein
MSGMLEVPDEAPEVGNEEVGEAPLGEPPRPEPAGGLVGS